MRPFQPAALLFPPPAVTGDDWVTKTQFAFWGALASKGVHIPPSNQGTRLICSNAASSETVHTGP